jgi:hypothetical protein
MVSCVSCVGSGRVVKAHCQIGQNEKMEVLAAALAATR